MKDGKCYIGIITPASPINYKLLEECLNILKNNNIEYKIINPPDSNHDNTKNKFSALSIEQRVLEIEELSLDKDIDFILATRGGYGCMEILESLDTDLLQKHSKPIIGCSDITALHLYYNKLGISTFHGPNLISLTSINQESLNAFFSFLNEKIIDESFLKYQGRIIGGNLSLICSLLGTDYLPDFKDKYLFIEDIGVKHYQIDRSLLQLKLAGVFDKLAGVLVGDFIGEHENSEFIKNIDVIKSFEDYVNIHYGFKAGHGRDNLVIPFCSVSIY